MKRLIFASMLLLGGNVCFAERSIQECEDVIEALNAMQRKLHRTIQSRRSNGRVQTNFSREARQMRILSQPVTNSKKRSELAFNKMHARRKTV